LDTAGATTATQHSPHLRSTHRIHILTAENLQSIHSDDGKVPELVSLTLHRQPKHTGPTPLLGAVVSRSSVSPAGRISVEQQREVALALARSADGLTMDRETWKYIVLTKLVIAFLLAIARSGLLRLVSCTRARTLPQSALVCSSERCETRRPAARARSEQQLCVHSHVDAGQLQVGGFDGFGLFRVGSGLHPALVSYRFRCPKRNYE